MITGYVKDDTNNGRQPDLFVVKIGGNVVDNEEHLHSFLEKFATINEKKILVHGGGKIATKIGAQLGIEPNYLNGRRITDAATIDLVTMVYGGLLNRKIVARLQSYHCNAIGLTGADANIIPATKRPVITQPAVPHTSKEGMSSANSPLNPTGAQAGPGRVDYGFVGDVDPSQLAWDKLQLFIENGLIPVIAPLTHDGRGQVLNTNADTIASAIALVLSEYYTVRLIYCFEKKGVLENMADEGSVIKIITKEKYGQLLKENKLFDGILPKIDNAFAAIDNGVNEVLIGDADDLLQNITGNTMGTLIK